MEWMPIEGNRQKLDGGAMFGNAPKAMWSRWYPVDELNRIDLSCRSLLVQKEGKNILFEVGIGDFFEPKYKDRYGVVESENQVPINLAKHGLSPDDIDVIVLSHLHFDHAGGLLSPHGATPKLIFENAQIFVGKEHWQRALKPNPRDRASFVPLLNQLLEESGRLNLVDGAHHEKLGDDIKFHFSNGHTPGLMISEIKTDSAPIFFMADLIPGTAWVHLPITMGYDRYPELLIEEKQQLLERVIATNGVAFYTHDPYSSHSRVQKNEKGRYEATDLVRVEGVQA